MVAQERLVRGFSYQRVGGALVPALAIILAIVIGGIVVGIAQQSVSAPLSGYWQLLKGAFGTPYDLSETLVAAIPLMFAAFAMAFAFRGGLFNIGAEGQLYAGAIVSTFVGYTLHWPGWLLLPVVVLISMLGGAAWAAVPGILKAWRGAHEVITTMMLNYIALDLMHYLLESNSAGQPGPMEITTVIGTPESPTVNALFPVIVPRSLVPNDRLSAVLLLALAAGVVFWFLLWRTTLGYTVRAVGFNRKAATYAGMNVPRTIIVTMLISGAFAGLSGMSVVFGIQGQLVDNFDDFTYGFNAIAVALLGRNTAVGSVLAAILFGALEHGGAGMQANAGINANLVSIIEGLIIFFIGADALVRSLARRGVIIFRRPGPKAPEPEPEEVAA
jgi:ABC-type uncharacterized transport system permease subunit